MNNVMSVLTILKYPDPFLKKVMATVPQSEFGTTQLETEISNMYETMYEREGIGLAATQVGINKRIFVMDHTEDRNSVCAFINPKILSKFGSVESEEGCLSFPGICVKVLRAERVIVEAYDLAGECFELDVEGIAAICVQHEIDHLDGITFFDHLSRLKRERAEKKYYKLS